VTPKVTLNKKKKSFTIRGVDFSDTDTGCGPPCTSVITNGKVAWPKGGTSPGCSATGTDWPSPDFVFKDVTGGWDAGDGQACIGIVELPVVKVGHRIYNLSFSFGSFYDSPPSDLQLRPGDSYSLTIDGVTVSGTFEV
jgi:hypothetical protein